ncbi:MAG: SRPBCC domain-containing protein [Chloroflexi bacterium]|nr:SRPBCC domain-containing protein [Chloroflexota bacterium]
MSSDRTVEHEIEVPGTPEQVWQAIATGEGITGWFVPATVEERTGGTLELDFGPGMGTSTGQVSVWEPPTRFVHLGMGAAGNQVAYEWQVEARSGGTCLVRLVTSGFLSEADWQAEYDGTAEGWQLFLSNLRLYLANFAGQSCASMRVQQLSDSTPEDTWRRLTSSLGLPETPTVGQQVSISNAPALRGRVERFQSRLLTVLLDAPGRGIGVVGTESFDGKGLPMVYLYLFGAGVEATIRREESAWSAWIERTF